MSAFFASDLVTRQRQVSSQLFKKARRTSLLWSGPAATTDRVSLFNLDIVNTTVEDAVTGIIFAAVNKVRQRVAFVNAHSVNTAAVNPHYAEVVASADRIFGDGSGMALAARLCGQALSDNVNGTDLFPLLCQAASRAGVKIFLLGGRPGVVEAALTSIKAVGFGDVVAGVHHGYIHRNGEEARVISKINCSGASILLVGMGVPIQDNWIHTNSEKLDPPVIMGVGGLFDFFAGDVSRAPTWVRIFGMEWCWRLAQEPRRMWRRYLLGNFTFIIRAILHAFAFRKKRWRRNRDRDPAYGKGGAP